MRSDGVILTNAHVVRNATHVTVTLENNREYTAKVIGMDVPTDIAAQGPPRDNVVTVVEKWSSLQALHAPVPT